MALWNHNKTASSSLPGGDPAFVASKKSNNPTPFRWLEEEQPAQTQADSSSFREMLRKHAQALTDSPTETHSERKIEHESVENSPISKAMMLPPKKKSEATSEEADENAFVNKDVHSSPFKIVSPFKESSQDSEPPSPDTEVNTNMGINPVVTKFTSSTREVETPQQPKLPTPQEEVQTVSLPLACLLSELDVNILGFEAEQLPLVLQAELPANAVYSQLGQDVASFPIGLIKKGIPSKWAEILSSVPEAAEATLPIPKLVKLLFGEETQSQDLPPVEEEQQQPSSLLKEDASNQIHVLKQELTEASNQPLTNLKKKAPKRNATVENSLHIQSNQLERSQLAIRIIFGVEETQTIEELIHLAEQVDGVSCAILVGQSLHSASASKALAQSAERTYECLTTLQAEVVHEDDSEFVSIETKRGTLCFFKVETTCLCVQLSNSALTHESREKIYLLAEACHQELLSY